MSSEDSVKVKQILIKRTHNIGNFSNLVVEMTAVVGEHEDPKEAAELLRLAVDQAVKAHVADLEDECDLSDIPFD